MTDSPSWRSPGEAPASGPWASPAGASAATGPHSGPYGPPAGSEGTRGLHPPSAGWVPPPKPGLIPLRPLDFGTIFGTTFRVLRRNPRPVFGVAIGLTTLVTFLAGGMVTVVVLLGTDRITRAAPEDAEAITVGTGAIFVVSALLTAALSVVAQALLQGVIAIEVSSGAVGERLTFRRIWARGKGRWGALVGWSLLLSAALVAAILILVLVIVLMVAFGDVAGIVGGVLVGILGGLGMAVLGFWLWIKLVFVSAAIVLERRSMREAVTRSWSLTRGRYWRTFGILILMSFVVQTAGGIVTAPFSLVAGFAGALVNPTGDVSADLGLLLGINLVAIALSAIVGAVGAVLVAGATTLVYLDARMRDEGLDLDLQRFVEARAQGAPSDDPYLAPAP